MNSATRFSFYAIKSLDHLNLDASLHRQSNFPHLKKFDVDKGVFRAPQQSFNFLQRRSRNVLEDHKFNVAIASCSFISYLLVDHDNAMTDLNGTGLLCRT